MLGRAKMHWRKSGGTKAGSKKKLWKAFSEFIRLRDSEDGVGICISCGRFVAYPNKSGKWHAGHFYPRSTTYSYLYFDEKNVNGQCMHCNSYLEGNKQGYEEGLIKKYGDGILEELKNKKVTGLVGVLGHEYEELAKHYRGLVRQMKKEKGIS